MRSRGRALLVGLLVCVGCAKTGPAVDEGGEGETGDGDGDGDLGGPEDDPEDPLSCWEPLGDKDASHVWGLSTQQLLISTSAGVLRVDGDAMTTFGTGSLVVWATDLDNGWISNGFNLERLVDGELELWPDATGFLTLALDGSGPNDLWAAGRLPYPEGEGDDRSAMAHFDGTSWTTIDVMQSFPSFADFTATIDDIEVTSSGVYFAAGWSVPQILRWDGNQPTTLALPESAHVQSLSSRDGERPFVLDLFCDVACVDGAYELGDGDDWAAADDLLPEFGDWDPVLHELAGLDDGSLWGIARDPVSDWTNVRAVYRDPEGQWRRVRVPEFTQSIHPLPDGAVVRLVGVEPPYRATTECLFGE